MKTLSFFTKSVIVATVALLSSPVRGQILLHELDSPNAVQFGQFGFAVAGVPDLSGDGVQDVIVGAPRESGGGRTHVFNGATGAEIYSIPGDPSGSLFGFYVAGFADIDGDGMGDFAAQTRTTAQQSVLVYSGTTGMLLDALQSPNDPLGDFGLRMAGVGDLNGDGASEILIGAPGEDIGRGSLVGRAYLFDGASTSPLGTLASPNKQPGGYYGWDVAAVPDMDGDGVNEYAIGAFNENIGRKGAGRVYVYNGATGALLLELASPNRNRGGGFGYSIAGLHDIDGDLKGDIAVGAPYETTGAGETHAGRVYIFSSATGKVLHTLVSPNAERYGWFGFSIARLQDMNGDGRDDLLVGAPSENPNDDFFSAGRCYVYNTVNGALQYEISSPNEEDGDVFGWSVAGLDDVNGDGNGDFVIGAYVENDTGRAYIYSGERNTP